MINHGGHAHESGNQIRSRLLAIATPIMNNLMEGSTEVDHAKHTRDFTERLKSIVTKERLEKVCRHYQAEWEYFSSRELIAVFRR
ncbi:MAG: hypothetical protein KC592_08285 [Nitrospira sp.]|nr:hypothetical protein [Nitrospira sp.]